MNYRLTPRCLSVSAAPQLRWDLWHAACRFLTALINITIITIITQTSLKHSHSLWAMCPKNNQPKLFSFRKTATVNIGSVLCSKLACAYNNASRARLSVFLWQLIKSSWSTIWSKTITVWVFGQLYEGRKMNHNNYRDNQLLLNNSNNGLLGSIYLDDWIWCFNCQ